MKKNKPILIAGIIMALTTILHLTGGQVDHVVPLLSSNIDSMDKAVLLGVWHLVSAVLFIMAVWLIRQGLSPLAERRDSMRLIAYINILFALVFVLVSIYRGEFTPQWILFLPMGLLVLLGLGKRYETAPV